MTVEEALSAIKNAVYGKDVRQAIHDGILQAEGGAGSLAKKAAASAKESEIASKAIEGKADQALTTARSADSKSDSTQLQLDEIVINGDSSVEAAQARVDIKNVSYPTLKDRLDKEQQEVNAQLAQTVKHENVKKHGAKGDGVTDDTKKIQLALDTHSPVIYVPHTGKPYMISQPLEIHSNQTLMLEEGAVIKLANYSNCVMIKNDDQTLGDPGNRNIKIIGGIWDGNRQKQTRQDNPRGTGNPETTWFGIVFQFFNVHDFEMRNIILNNPTSWGVVLGDVHHFIVDNIFLDYGEIPPINTDGIHLTGLCDNGVINNIYGTTGDDMVALNADDYGVYRVREGDIYNISISNIFGINGYRGIRLLSNTSSIYNVKIENIFGTYKNSAVLFSRPIGLTGLCDFRNIVIDTVNAELIGNGEGVINFDANVKNVIINNITRKQEQIEPDLQYKYTISIGIGWEIDDMQVNNMYINDRTTKGIGAIFVSGSSIKRLVCSNIVRTEPLVIDTADLIVVQVDGSIDNLILDNCSVVGYHSLVYHRSGLIKNLILNNITTKNTDNLVNIYNSTLLNMSYSNVIVENFIDIFYCRIKDGSNTRITGKNLTKIKDETSRYEVNIILGPTSNISIDAKDLHVGIGNLTGVEGDIVYNTTGDNAGLATFEGGKWYRLRDGIEVY